LSSTLNTVSQILNFWFGEPSEPNYGQFRPIWFMSSPEFDNLVKAQFLALYTQAKEGTLDNWVDTPQGILALILLLDQFPRNMFRNQAQAFETDQKACLLAKKAISEGYDQQLALFMQPFIYMPLEHSENKEDQRLSVNLFQKLGDLNYLNYALQHQEVINRFGRFPYRNSVLGRMNTPEETQFLNHTK